MWTGRTIQVEEAGRKLSRSGRHYQPQSVAGLPNDCVTEAGWSLLFGPGPEESRTPRTLGLLGL